VSESVNLREEHATIERRPVDRPATVADLKEGFVEVRETAEEPVVAKTARVVEEVIVGKESSNRTETVNDTVRGTDVEVERVAGQEGVVRPDVSVKKP
jgi:stress response protein YsnF